MSIHARFAGLLAAVVLALGACERAPGTPADAPADAAADAPGGAPAAAGEAPAATDEPVDATAVVDRAPIANAPVDFDVRAFAGTFAAAGTTLRLAADGTYTLVVHAESADADLASTGTWTVEGGGAGLLLDPDSKDEPDRRYAITSREALAAVDGGQVLRRDDA